MSAWASQWRGRRERRRSRGWKWSGRRERRRSRGWNWSGRRERRRSRGWNWSRRRGRRGCGNGSRCRGSRWCRKGSRCRGRDQRRRGNRGRCRGPSSRRRSRSPGSWRNRRRRQWSPGPCRRAIVVTPCQSHDQRGYYDDSNYHSHRRNSSCGDSREHPQARGDPLPAIGAVPHPARDYVSAS